MTPAELISFEEEVADAFEAKKIRGPIHLAGGNELELIEIFKGIRKTDYVCSTWRSHYHALLHGVPREKVMAEIMAGRSMTLHFPQYRFMSSAIVGGCLPIACGLAAAGNKVWVFVGDMAASIGAFHEAVKYADGHGLSINFVEEDNGHSTNTPTLEAWGGKSFHSQKHRQYAYERTQPHCGSGVYVAF